MCPKCGHQIDTDHNFCSWCRADLRPLMTKCGKCGGTYHTWFLPKKINGCPSCGVDASQLQFPSVEILKASNISCNGSVV